MASKFQQSRQALVETASVLVLGAAVWLGGSSFVRSQPAVPAPAAAPVAAPAASPVLRDDQIQLLLGVLAEADSHGIASAQFGRTEIEALLASRDPAERQRGVIALQKAVVAYARAQHGLRLDAADAPADWSIRPAAYDAQADYGFALSQDKLAQWVASLPPPFERYRALRTALGQYRAIAAKGGWPAIDPGKPLKPGMTDPRVIQLRQRLAAENPPGSIDTTSPLYDPQLAAIVAAAQVRYGLDGDSVIGPGALKAFNVPVEGRIAQIAANMERWRWMPRAWPASRIEVNIAGQHLDVFDQNKSVLDMNVVVGAPDKKTPMLASQIHSVVLNPPWNVPSSITTKELAPKGAAYLASHGFAWIATSGGGARLQQKPGPGNSLGRIKFDFNNPFGVYLHDTNAKAAFERDARAVSHGCVRVARPEELADLLLGAGTDSVWSPEKIDAVLADTETVRAPLGQKIPVMLLYWTVFTSPTGEVSFRNDVYGWDQQLISLLGRGAISA